MRLFALSESSGCPIAEFDSVLQPIIDTCTKDAISNGKTWMVARCGRQEATEFMSVRLLQKTVDPMAPFSARLHLIYLVNDVIHYCVRKGAEHLR
jgi:calcium homeostasis ER protein